MSDIFNSLWLENQYQLAIEGFDSLTEELKLVLLKKYDASTKEEYAEKRARQVFEERGL